MFLLDPDAKNKIYLKMQDQLDSLQRALDVLEDDANAIDRTRYLEKQVSRARERAEDVLEMLGALEYLPCQSARGLTDTPCNYRIGASR